MKILFLDVDGVLNSRRSAVAFGKFPWDVEPDDLKLFDNVAIGFVKKLCDETGCKIVLSSTWRGKDGMFEKMARVLDLPIIDKTPTKISGNRGHEIEAWLESMCLRHPELNTTGIDYAIVDDDSDMLEDQLPYFVQTCPQDGFLLKHFDALKQILTPTSPDKEK